MKDIKAVYFDMGGVLLTIDESFTPEVAITYSLNHSQVQKFLPKDFNVEEFCIHLVRKIRY
ncbi:hypothetical protein JW979_08420, partial [bacterium]|nr:hypothetical protein [candidate division CSSED10-310 bacterium]